MESGHIMGGLPYLLERVARLNPNGGKVEAFLAKACQEFVRLAAGETWVYLATIAVGLGCCYALSKGSQKNLKKSLMEGFADLNHELAEAWRKANSLPAVGKAKAAFGKAKAAIGKAKAAIGKAKAAKQAARLAKEAEVSSAKLDREIGKFRRAIQRDGL